MRLEGKSAIVTGAGQGIGRVIALSLAKEGADVVVSDTNIETATRVANEIRSRGRRALAIKADVTRSHEVEEMVKIALNEFGKIDILVNNAGGSARERMSEFRESTEPIWDFVLGRNLGGVLICSRAVINHMIERGYGRIISIASVAGIIGGTGQADYSAAKAGIIGFTRVLAKEVGRYGVNVNAVSPGVIRTGALEESPREVVAAYLSRQVLKRAGQPEDVANAVIFLASDEASFITGQNLVVCGGVSL